MSWRGDTITVATDAGYRKDGDWGTWACYIRTPTETIQHSGYLRGYQIGNSTKAERMALANALYILTQKYNLSGYRLIVYCDNGSALLRPKEPKQRNYTNPDKIKRLANRQANLAWYDTYIGKHLNQAKSVDLRDIVGHLPMHRWDKTSKRHFLNRWCDKECKRLSRIELRRLRDES